MQWYYPSKMSNEVFIPSWLDFNLIILFSKPKEKTRIDYGVRFYSRFVGYEAIQCNDHISWTKIILAVNLITNIYIKPYAMLMNCVSAP